MGKSKSPAPTPQPVMQITPKEQTPAQPINRNASNAEARDRVASNASADLLSTGGATDEEARKQASLMG